jgi:ferredoxin
VGVSVEIRIDPILCRGHAICALFFSDAVDLDQWGFGKVAVAVAETPRDIRRAYRAAAACPNGAFVVREREPAPTSRPG